MHVQLTEYYTYVQMHDVVDYMYIIKVQLFDL